MSGSPGMEGAKDPVGSVSVGSEGRGCCFGVPAHHEGGVQRPRESAPRGQGGGGERRGGGPRPALECIFSLVFFLFGGLVEATSSFLCLSFVFPYCWWSGRPTMTGQAGPGARDEGI